ncbi:unnamed protein product [Closterium sp. NIES-54]
MDPVDFFLSFLRCGGQGGTERTPLRHSWSGCSGSSRGTWRSPIHLVELFGGIGAGLSAVVRNGIAVRRWTYVEKEPVVRRMAEHHARKLQAKYPELLNERVIREAMGGTTHDVKEISEAEVASWGQVDLLVAGWGGGMTIG